MHLALGRAGDMILNLPCFEDGCIFGLMSLAIEEAHCWFSSHGQNSLHLQCIHGNIYIGGGTGMDCAGVEEWEHVRRTGVHEIWLRRHRRVGPSYEVQQKMRASQSGC